MCLEHRERTRLLYGVGGAEAQGPRTSVAGDGDAGEECAKVAGVHRDKVDPSWSSRQVALHGVCHRSEREPRADVAGAQQQRVRRRALRYLN